MGLMLPDPDGVARLETYLNELLKWNSKVNLVAREMTVEEILEKHFLDSLSLLSVLERNVQDATHDLPSLLDVGSGAGFPGLVLKIARPDLSVTLVEPREKRVYFLRQVIRVLGLRNIEVVPARLGGGGADPLGGKRYSTITSRAFSELSFFLGLVAPYCGRQGRIIAMKGPRGLEEVAALHADPAMAQRWPLLEKREFDLPFSRSRRLLLVFGHEKENQSDRPKTR